MDAGGSAWALPANRKAIGKRYLIITKLLSLKAQKHFGDTALPP
jgi:hypothetical protein